MKPFEKWLTEELKITFGLREAATHPLLSALLATPLNITDAEKLLLAGLQKRLRRKANFWNEDELKLFFISEILNLVDFNYPEVYSAFSQRTFSASVKDISDKPILLRGRIEFLVAQGEQIPRRPYFLVHEYKPQLKGHNDPLIALQALNEGERPIYGVYVLGQFWYFVVLQEKEYATGNAFDATQDDLLQVVSMLKQIKQQIEQEVLGGVTV
jgi:hypothetical protein